jgi:hypothetical protein
MELKLTAEQAKKISWEDTDEFEVIELEPWEDDGKYSYRGIIFKKLDGDQYFYLSISRSGSYFSDYYYCYEDATEYTCPQVEQVEIKKTVWKVIK